MSFELADPGRGLPANINPRYVGPPDGLISGTVVGRRHTQASAAVLNVVDLDGSKIEVPLSQLTKASVQRAQVPAHTVENTEAAALEVYQNLARAPIVTAAEMAQMVGQPAEGPPTAPAYEQPPRAGYTEQGRPQAPPMQRPMAVAAPPGGLTAALQGVTYSMAGYGELEVFYQQVIRNGPWLVFVYDLRVQMPTRFFPQPSEQVFGLRIHGTDRLFAVRTTGVRFQLDHNDLCVLRIEQEGSWNEYNQQTPPKTDSLEGVLAGLGFPGDVS